MPGMLIDLSGRTALVTGSTAGIGRAIAAALGRAGAHVIVNGRDAARTSAAAAELAEETGGSFEAQAGDVGTPDGVATLVAASPAVDILVNNAGVFAEVPLLEIPDSEWQRFFDVNVMSGVRLTRALLPGMMERGWGRVVFISSESAINIPSAMVHYGMTKTAQLAVSRGFAQEARGTGVTVNAVLPGPTRTEGVEAMLGNPADVEAAGRAFVREHRLGSLLGRLASVEEIANIVTYTCSPQASATTGAALRVDGGLIGDLG